MKEKSLLRGAVLMSIGFFFIACFGAFLKVSAERSSVLFAVWITYASSLVIQFCVMIPKGWQQFKTRHIVKHFFRGGFGVLATILYVLALGHILLMNATLLFNTTPLFIPILTVICLRHRVSWKVWLSILLGFIGVIFIIHPTAAIFQHPWSLIGLASGLSLAIAFLFVKALTETEPMMRIVFYFVFFGTLLLSCFLPFYWMLPDVLGWVYGVAAGISMLLVQFFVVKAYEAADPSSVGPFQYVGVVVAGLIDWVFWHRVPTWSDYVGAVIVIVAGSLVILLTARPKKAS